ncbi:MAG: cytoplasmic protein [Ignavibacteriae bacterium]|nr:cytoplasmic protein [Ignavibacteriota bacterium]
MKYISQIMLFLFILLFLSNKSNAQDAVKVDPEHYKVEFENDQVRVLRITYGPGEKSVMHSHPEGVVVELTDGTTKMTFPDGTSKEMSSKAGDVGWAPAGKHQPENLSDKPFEVIQIELKTKKEN